MKFCGEIAYNTNDGNVHSDICFECGLRKSNPLDKDYRDFLHKCLDEWLDKSNGTGGFWVGDPDYFSPCGEE